MLSIRKLAKAHGLRQRQLAEILQTDQSVISLIVNGHRRLTEDHIELLRAQFGAEELAKYEVDEDIQRQRVDMTLYPSALVDEVREEVREELRQPKREDVEGIDGEEVEIKETVIISPEVVNRVDYDIKKKYEDGTLEAITKPTQDVVPFHDMKVYTENDEMEPEIGPNDPIFVSFMQSASEVISGRMYFVDLYQGAVVRWVFPQDDGTLLLRAANSATPDLVVKTEEVRSVSKVVAILKRPKSMPVEQLTVQATLEHRDNQINEMLTQQGRLIGIIEKHNGIEH